VIGTGFPTELAIIVDVKDPDAIMKILKQFEGKIFEFSISRF